MNFTHIGMAKTGTTYLQNVIFKNHKDICYFGKNSAIEDINLIGKSIYSRNKNSFNYEHAISVFQHQNRIDDKGCLLYSEEILSSYLYAAPSLMASRLSSLMGKFHPIMVIREPSDWLESMYFFRLYNFKQEATLGFEYWLNNYNLNSGMKSDIYSLNYGVTAEIYRAASQQEKISVLFYEDFKQNRVNFLKKLSEILSINSMHTIELASQHIPSAHNDKLRINTKQAEFLWNCSYLYRGEIKQFQKVVDTQLKDIRSETIGDVGNQARDLFDSKSLDILKWVPTLKRITRLLEEQGALPARILLSSELRDYLAKNAREQQLISSAISEKSCKDWGYF